MVVLFGIHNVELESVQKRAARLQLWNWEYEWHLASLPTDSDPIFITGSEQQMTSSP